MRLIDADKISESKFHPLPYTHITPTDVNAESYKRGWNDAIDAIIADAPTAEEPQWIPWDSGKFPEESGTYAVTAYDGATKRVTYAKYQKRLKRWELTGARAYWRVLAWMPLPEPWKGDA